MKKTLQRGIVFVLLILAHGSCLADPFCVKPGAKNYVVATVDGDLTNGWGGILVLHGIDSTAYIDLHHCRADRIHQCFYATDVAPGRYYFQQVIPEGDNHFYCPVSTPQLWVQVTAKGVDYLGHWTIERQGRAVSKLDLNYSSEELDQIVDLCELEGRPLYLDRIRSDAVEIVD